MPSVRWRAANGHEKQSSRQPHATTAQKSVSGKVRWSKVRAGWREGEVGKITYLPIVLCTSHCSDVASYSSGKIAKIRLRQNDKILPLV